MTRYEAKIYDIINTSHDHLTAEEIFLKLKSTESKVVLATIYNNLNKLCENKNILKISVEGQPDKYDKNIKHDHLVCLKCKKLFDFSFNDLTKTLEEQTGMKINGYDLKVSFICPECKKVN